MKKLVSFLIGIFAAGGIVSPQVLIDSLLPVRGFCIAAPQSPDVDRFIRFISEELVPRKVNTLILRVDYRYQYESHPELREEGALTKAEMRKIVSACKKYGIAFIPQINLLGHQSWASTPNKLLSVYPEFDETPWVKMPEKYEWPNADRLYCKSYCPLHPKVHKVIFALVDEICDVCEASSFHAGMDEVFYIGESQCPRCEGYDRAELFAGEVRLIRDHLALKGRTLWIWGDRLLDGKTTGLGEWEASYNNTYRAVDLIPKDVVICDWHYDQAVPTTVYFAMKGFCVVSCPWRKPEVAVQQVNDIIRFRRNSPLEMSERFKGVVQTVWSDAGAFIDDFYGIRLDMEKEAGGNQSPAASFRALFDTICQIE